jgi:hypothetical protein
LPTTSIDTFFACTLLVSVAIIATAFLAGTMQTQITGIQDTNKQDYLRAISDHIVSGYGAPIDWGIQGGTPNSFGLSKSDATNLFDLDQDKVTRLNSQNIYSLSYLEIFDSARLNNIALGLSVSQMLQIHIELSSNETADNNTAYTFRVFVEQDAGPVSADLHCYALASDFESDVFNETSSLGIGALTVELPNSFSGPVVLILFARAMFDDRLTAFEVYSFGHLSEMPKPNRTLLGLSPLNHTLTITPNSHNAIVGNVSAFSYCYQSNLTSTSNTSYLIPQFTDCSPIVLLVQGTDGNKKFCEWTAYAQVPLTIGADFSRSETNVFVYDVTVDGVLYKLTLRLGDVAK